MLGIIDFLVKMQYSKTRISLIREAILCYGFVKDPSNDPRPKFLSCKIITVELPDQFDQKIKDHMNKYLSYRTSSYIRNAIKFYLLEVWKSDRYENDILCRYGQDIESLLEDDLKCD